MALERITVDLQKLERRVERLETQDSPTAVTAAAGGAPTGAQYVVMAYNGSLTQERLLQAAAILTVTDGGANNPVTIAIGDYARGSMIVGGAALWEDLTIGATSTHLESDGTDVAWQVNLTMADDAWIGAAANDVRVEFDNSSGFLKLGLGDAAGSDRVQVLDNSPAVVAYINSNGDADFEGHVVIGSGVAVSATQALSVVETFTPNAGIFVGTSSSLNYAPTGNHTAEAYALLFTSTLTTAQTRTGGGLWGVFGRTIVASGIDARDLNLLGGFFSVDVEDAGSGGGTGAIVAAGLDTTTPFVNTGNCLLGYGLRITQGTVGAGSVFLLYGINIADINAGTASFAISTNAGNVVFNEGGDVLTDIRFESNNFTHMFFLDSGFDSVLINSSADLNSTFGVVATVAADIGVVIRGFDATQSGALLQLEGSGGAIFFTSGDGLAGSNVTWNQQGVDINYSIRAVGVADAFEVRGSDGQITLGVLGAGFVQSTAGGVLSSAAIGAGDLPAHTHSGAGQGGSLAVGTTDTDLTAGSVFFAGAAGVFQQDNVNFFWDDGNNRLGIGTNAPGVELHVLNATTTADVNIQTNQVNGAAFLRFINDAQSWRLGVNTGDQFQIRDVTGLTNPMTIEAGVVSNMLYLDSSGNVGINTTGPDRKLDVLDAANPQLRLTHTDGVTYVDFQANANGYLFIDPTGDRTGFRTNTPSYIVHVPWQAGDAVTTMLVGDGAAAANNQIAIRGDSFSNVGVRGTSESSQGVGGISISGAGGSFQSTSDFGVHAASSTGTALVANLTGAGTAIAKFQENGPGNEVVIINIGGSSPLEVIQPGAGGAVAVLDLDQNDIDEPFIHFDGTSVNGAITGNLVDEGDQGGQTLEGWVRMQITDSAGNVADGDYWIPFYSLIA